MRVIFFKKYLKFLLDFKNAAKNWENVFCFWDNYIWNGIIKLSLLRMWYISSAANVLTSSNKIGIVRNRDSSQLYLLGSTQWVWYRFAVMLWCRFQQCLRTFTMLLVEGSSETRLFRRLSDHVFGVRKFGNTKSMRVIFFFKKFKIYCGFQKCTKKLRKSLFFSEIIASELVIFISSQCVSKQSQDLACEK